jgi:hypothetical protein
LKQMISVNLLNTMEFIINNSEAVFVVLIPFVIINGIILYRIVTKENALVSGALQENMDSIQLYVNSVENVVKINVEALAHNITKAKIRTNLEAITELTKVLITEQNKILEDISTSDANTPNSANNVSPISIRYISTFGAIPIGGRSLYVSNI